jgi:hypothetical protein
MLDENQEVSGGEQWELYNPFSPCFPGISKFFHAD